MESLDNFKNKRLNVEDSSSLTGGKRLRADTPTKGKDVTVLKDGEVKKFITGAGWFDGVPRD